MSAPPGPPALPPRQWRRPGAGGSSGAAGGAGSHAHAGVGSGLGRVDSADRRAGAGVDGGSVREATQACITKGFLRVHFMEMVSGRDLWLLDGPVLPHSVHVGMLQGRRCCLSTNERMLDSCRPQMVSCLAGRQPTSQSAPGHFTVLIHTV
eukprot:365226-Chlamydomonas_euryale.AAC.17